MFMIYINVFASDKGFLKRWKVPGPESEDAGFLTNVDTGSQRCVLVCRQGFWSVGVATEAVGAQRPHRTGCASVL